MEFSEVGGEVGGEAEQKDAEISMPQPAKGMSAETVKQSEGKRAREQESDQRAREQESKRAREEKESNDE